MGRVVRGPFLRVVEQDALEQLDGLFYDLVRLVSLRAVQGLGLDKTLDEMSTKFARISVHRSLQTYFWSAAGGMLLHELSS